MNTGWVKAETKPVPESEVLIVVESRPGKFSIVMGLHLPKFHRTTEDQDFDGDCDCGETEEDEDMLYWPEGWYETHCYGEEDYMTWTITDPVVAWMPLPEYEP